MNHKRVERLMALHGIHGRCGRRRVRTTIRDPHARPATDLVNRCFDRQQLNESWVGDITYIPTGEGWLYLASVLDLFSRRLIGWSIAEHMRTELVTDALEIGRRPPAAATGRGVVFHSDHGSQGGFKGWSQHWLVRRSVDSSSRASAGVFQPRVLRGRVLSARATASRSSREWRARSVPFGKYWRSRPLVFSLVPRCHGLCGSQK